MALIFKQVIRKFIYQTMRSASRNSFFLSAMQSVVKPVKVVFNILDYTIKTGEESKSISLLVPKISPNLTVQGGLFKGMRYARAGATGSAFLPKILGTYEVELLSVWQYLTKQKFDLVVDIGCAEGYYAVGSALIFPKTPIYAFDIDPEARKLCKENTIANSVQEQVKISTECTGAMLSDLCRSKHGLLICDVEGYEVDLFENTQLECLSFCYLLIELHDGVDPTISERIKNLFEKSHEIESIFSIDDIHRPRFFSEYNSVNLNKREVFEAMKEKRCHVMEWVFLSPKTLNAELNRDRI